MKKLIIILAIVGVAFNLHAQTETKVRYLQIEENKQTSRIYVDAQTPYSIKTELNSNKQIVVNVYKGNELIATYPEGTKIYPKAFTNEQVEQAYQDIKVVADSVLLSDKPDWAAFENQYKDRDEIKEIAAQEDGLMIEFVNGEIRGWLIPPKPSEISWDNNTISKMQLRSASQIEEAKPKLLVVNATYNNEDHQWDKVRDSIANIASLFEAKGWNVDIRNGEEANVQFYKNEMNNYDVIYNLTHGMLGLDNTWILTGERFLKNINDYALPNKQMAIINVNEIHNGEEVSVPYWALSGKYFSSNYANKSFPNSLIYLAACHGLEYPEQLAKIFIDRGTKVVVGWNNTNGLGHITGNELFSYMLNNYTNLVSAINQLPINKIHDAEHGATLTVYPPNGDYQFPTALQTYTITAAILSAGGSINPNGEQQYTAGSDVTFEITADAGYEIDKVLVDGTDRINEVSSGRYVFSNVSANHTIYVSFVEIPNPTLFLSTDALNFPASGGEQTFVVASNLDWTVSTDASLWLTIDPMSGSNNETVTVTAKANTSPTQLKATIFVRGKDVAEQTISVTQDANSPDPELTAKIDDNSPVPASGGTRVITITSNTDWTVSSDAPWLTIYPTAGSNDGTVTVTTPSYSTLDGRSADILIRGVGARDMVIKITQMAGQMLALNYSDNMDFIATGGQKTFEITSDLAWNISSDASWCTVSPSSGGGNSTITVITTANITSNQRIATISVDIGNGYPKTVSVTQEAASSGGSDNEEGVVINGVRWATRNVDAPGTFAKNPEDAGMFYQWGKNVGWSSTDPMINSNGGTTWNSTGSTSFIWERANDPSPAGWRVPNNDEFQSLFNPNKVSQEKTIFNGVNGCKFTDITTGKSIFLPAAGLRTNNAGVMYYRGSYGQYWSNTTPSGDSAYYMLICSNNDGLAYNYRAYGYTLRSVAE